MRTVGIILIVIGVLMMAFRGFNYTEEKNVIDAGPIKVNKEEKKHIGWPVYSGAILALAGLGLVFIPAKKKE